MSKKKTVKKEKPQPSLITVDQWAEKIKHRNERMRETGVLCPQCEEFELLWDFTLNLRLDPPERNVECSNPKCIYKGRLRF